MKHLVIDGLDASQSVNVYAALDSLLPNLQKEVNVIEIGTGHGGFTCLLANFFTANNIAAKIASFDTKNYNSHTASVFSSKGISYHLMDYSSQSAANIINPIIAENKQCLVFCDNGKKPEEFNHFSNLIKKGDFIFAHDYG